MAFNPELGSTSPAVLLDNAERLDKLVNGSALTEPDRAGDDLDTWRGMMAKNDEVRQNLIPLSKQYATLAAAQADIANIPVGSTTYYRSPDDSALAVEVMNVSGTLQPTGRKMPSQAELDKIAHALEESVEITETLSRLTLTEALSLTASGSWSLSDEAVGQLRTASLPAGGDTSAKLVLTAGTNEFFSRDFFPGETLTDGDITTHYNPLYLKEMTVSNVIVEANVLRAAFFPVVGDGVVATSQYTAFDPEHDFASIRADQGSTTALRGVVLHSSGTYLQVTIPRTELSAAEYPASRAALFHG